MLLLLLHDLPFLELCADKTASHVSNLTGYCRYVDDVATVRGPSSSSVCSNLINTYVDHFTSSKMSCIPMRKKINLRWAGQLLCSAAFCSRLSFTETFHYLNANLFPPSPTPPLSLFSTPFPSVSLQYNQYFVLF